MTSQYPSFIHANANDGRRQEPRSQYDSPFRSEQEKRQKMSTNPYRQRQGRQEPASGTRKNTPVRAVYYDLPTAHSSITSGSARSRYRATSLNKSEVHEEEDSIPLEDLEPSFLQNLPLPPLPAIVSSSRYGDCSDERLDSERRVADYSTYHSSLGAAPSGSLPPSSSLPDGSTIGNIYEQYARSDEADDGYDADSDHRAKDHRLPSGTSLDEQLRPSALNVRKRRREERVVDSSGQPPRHAVPNLPSPTALRVTPSTSHGVTMTHSSSYGDTHNLLDITQNAENGNAHWLPGNRNKAAMSRSNCHSNLKTDQSVSKSRGDSASIVPQATYLNPNNPFRRNAAPRVLVSHAEEDFVFDGPDDYAKMMEERLPLEREVSKALRRASGFSAYSNASISSSVLEQFGKYRIESRTSQNIGLLRRLHTEEAPQSGSEDVDEKGRILAAQAQAFYDQGAIAPDWITARQHNAVRVPIHHKGSMPDSPPDSLHDLDTRFGRRAVTPKEQEDDMNDWETVGESAFGTEFKGGKDTPRILGGTVHRAGSSIANTSDEGTQRTPSPHIPEIDEFGSTERIAQHPGNIRYFGDYRQRDLKKTRIPVFLPVFREHKINGYMADSTRIRPPPNPFGPNPLPPLAKPHANPFNSPPPDIKTVRAVKPSYSVSRDQGNRNRRLFPPPTITLSTSEESEITKHRFSPHHTKRPFRAAEPLRQTYDWMDDFGDPGPAINMQQFSNSDVPYRPTSWQHMMTFARGDTGQGFNPDGSRVANSSAAGTKYTATDIPLKSGLLDNAQTDGFVETRTHPRKETVTQVRDHKPLVKGPPGAFYKDLRSRPDSKHASRSYERERSSKVPARHGSTTDCPTNTLRPLSLLADQRPSTPMRAPARPSEETVPNDFVYRSPLAPPLRNSWKQLYSKSQLSLIREAAKGDGFLEAQTVPNGGLLRASIKHGGSCKHLFEAPRLFRWPRETSTRNGLCERKRKISVVVLYLCNIFPPMLFLYAIGRLDGIIVWWTNGEFSTFGKSQKRWACIAMCCWGLATFVGLVAFLIYRFSGHGA